MTSRAQMCALARRGDLRAMQLGGRQQWRVERVALEQFIVDSHAATKRWVRDHPFSGGDEESESSRPSLEAYALRSRDRRQTQSKLSGTCRLGVA